MPWYVVFRGKEPGVYHQWANFDNQVSGYCDNCYKRFDTKDKAIMAFGAYMKGGTYKQKVEHGVCKQEAEVLKQDKGRNPITPSMMRSPTDAVAQALRR
jgi:viroplasmin and RNaseH domain-containing protein